MNRQIPKITSADIAAVISGKKKREITHLALPVVNQDGFEFNISNSQKKEIEKTFGVSLSNELKKAGSSFTGKAGEIVEIPFLAEQSNLLRIYCVSIGDKTPSDLRKAGAALGRKVKGSSAKLLTICPTDEANALTHLIALALGSYTWSEKSGPKPDTPSFLISNSYSKIIKKAEVLISGTWRTRDLIHTPANIATPEWISNQAKVMGKNAKVSVKVLSGASLREFGGLRAVGNSSTVHPPRFVLVSYQPKVRKAPHVVLVGKGITFDTGGVSLKRPYDVMIGMKSDMSGAAAALLTVISAAELKIPVRVTALLMLAENALSATAQRPSDVIQHYGGTTVEVINTDAEGRLVLADGLSYADKHLDPDYLIDIATLTGAATLGLSRYYAAMYTRDEKLAQNLNRVGDYIGDRVWHMPLVDDYSIALESDVADFNHTADKFSFQGGSITAALFLEKFVGNRRWVHLDIAGPARSENDSGENPKGGTGFGVRLLTQWMTTL